MASADISVPSSGLMQALTFRDTRAAFLYGVAGLALLGLLYVALDYAGIDSTVLSYFAGAIVLFLYLNGLWSVRESIIAMVGITLVAFWVFLSVTASVLPLHEPSETTGAFTSYVATGGVDISAAPPDVQEALTKLKGIETVLSSMGENAPKALKDQADTFRATVDEYASQGAGRTSFGVEFQDRTHWLSVDQKGRDLLSRIVWGAQRVLFWASLATFVAYSVGMMFGVAAGYLGGWVDEGISFVANVMLAFPIMVLFILIVQALGASGMTVIVAVTFASAPAIMRIVRGLALDIRSRDYIAAAQTRGENPWYIMVMELLPNARGPLIVDACLRLGYTTIAIATLSFLGLGLPPPDPDWGAQMSEARELAQSYPFMIVYPAIALSSLILGFNLLADGLRDISLRD